MCAAYVLVAVSRPLILGIVKAIWMVWSRVLYLVTSYNTHSSMLPTHGHVDVQPIARPNGCKPRHVPPFLHRDDQVGFSGLVGERDSFDTHRLPKGPAEIVHLLGIGLKGDATCAKA